MKQQEIIKQIKMILSTELPSAYSPKLDSIAKYQVANYDPTTGEYCLPSHMASDKKSKRIKIN